MLHLAPDFGLNLGLVRPELLERLLIVVGYHALCRQRPQCGHDLLHGADDPIQPVAQIVARDRQMQIRHLGEDQPAKGHWHALAVQHLRHLPEVGRGVQLLGRQDDQVGAHRTDRRLHAAQRDIGPKIDHIPAAAAQEQREHEGHEGMFFLGRTTDQDASGSRRGRRGCQQRLHAANRQCGSEVLLLDGNLTCIPTFADLRQAFLDQLHTNRLCREKGKGLCQQLFRMILVESQTGRHPGFAQLPHHVCLAHEGTFQYWERRSWLLDALQPRTRRQHEGDPRHLLRCGGAIRWRG